MTDGDALYAAILAAPDEDTPRLAFADWLDEADDPDRAEFIRVQVALSRLTTVETGTWHPRTLELLAREKALLATHSGTWLAPLQVNGGPLEHPGSHGQFRRGFAEVVWMPEGWFRKSAEVLFARLPVRELRVTETTPEGFGRLVEFPLLGRLAGLDLSDRRLGDTAAGQLAWSPFTGGLRVLRLRGCGITDEGAFQLADADFDQLRELDVAHNPIGPAGLAALRDRFGAAVRAEPAPGTR